MTLSEFRPGDKGIIQQIDCNHPEFASRMYALGIVPGQVIELLHQAPLGDPVQIRVGLTLVSLRRKDAQVIRLQKELSCVFSS